MAKLFIIIINLLWFFGNGWMQEQVGQKLLSTLTFWW